MWRSLLSSGRTGVSRWGNASGRTTPSGPAGISLRVLTTEGEPFWAQAKTSHAIRYVFLQGAEETHFYCWCSFFRRFLHEFDADIDFSSDRMCHRRLLLEYFLGDRIAVMYLKIYRHRSRGKSTRHRSPADTSWRKVFRPRKLLRYFVASQYRFSATAICDFSSDPFRDSPERFLLAAEVIVLRRVLKILHSFDVLAHAVGSRQSSVKNWEDKIRCVLYNWHVEINKSSK